MKLISMTDFVLRQGETSTHETEQQDWYFKEVVKLDKIRNYAQFLKQPLELWMFVPCKKVDGVWVVLEGPKWENEETDYEIQILVQEYQQAKERCLFEGFIVIGQEENYFELELHGKDFWITFINNKCQIEEDFDIENIEYLFMNSLEDLTLTKTAQKQIGCDH